MSSLRVMAKRSRGKKQQEETKKQQHVIVAENNLFKRFYHKKSSKLRPFPASLTAMEDGAADLSARNFPQREEFHAMPL